MNYQDALENTKRALELLNEITPGITRFHKYIDDAQTSLEYAIKDVKEVIELMPEEKAPE